MSLAAYILAVTSFVILFFFIFITFTLSMRMLVVLFKFNELNSFGSRFKIVGILLFLSLKNFLNFFDLGWIHWVWELDFKVDKKITKFIGSLMEWHTKTFTCHSCIWLDSFALLILNSDHSSIKMHNCEINSCQSFQ